MRHLLIVVLLAAPAFARPLEGLPLPRDRAFMIKAASDGMAEVKLAQLAMDRASKPEVKAFAKKMIDDHTQAGSELQALATREGVALPSEPTTEAMETYGRLERLSGETFDKAYLEAMCRDHDKAVIEFGRESAEGSDPAVKAFANKTLLVIKQHDDLAHADRSQVN